MFPTDWNLTFWNFDVAAVVVAAVFVVAAVIFIAALVFQATMMKKVVWDMIHQLIQNFQCNHHNDS